MSAQELTPREVATELGVSVRTVQRWISAGRLPATRVGARVRVSRSSLGAVSEEDLSRVRRPIRAILVANRGEIVVRIARTARRMGVRVIGVHTEGERPPDGVDEARSIDSYLDAGALVATAVATGADAVHPGYGFLSERAEFAVAVSDAGLTWIGPPASAISAMGDKAAARRRATAAGLPTVPGYDGDAQDDESLRAAADEVGYPVLVKPAAGGGGKGMHRVESPAQLAEALAAARREAQRSFGDDRLVLERYLAGARHVEVQVLFDEQGAGVHLGERDCSAQRRSQKVVEEAPAPSVNAAMRERLAETALGVARTVGYVGAGTVEMLLAEDGRHHFLEMNTRLQVEHPVTEAVTGVDLVEAQLRIAEGAPLSSLGLAAPPPLHGHAVEARIYAEDPEGGFLPASGRLLRVAWPSGVRVDTGVASGDVVSDRFDPMLAKLVAYGPSRPEALDRLREALAGTVVLGVRTNVRFLRWLLDTEPMRSGEVRTETIATSALPDPATASDEDWSAAAEALARPSGDPWSGGWRLSGPAVLRLWHEGEERSVPVGPSRERAVEGADGSAHVLVEGQSLEFRIAAAPTVDEAVRHATASSEGGADRLVAPMPGRVVAVRHEVGARVAAHEAVVIIEAMKMEHAVVAPRDGMVRAVHVGVGAQVQRGDVIAEVASYHADDG